MYIKKLVTVIVIMSLIEPLSAQRIEKMLPMRSGDSLWIYQRAFGSTQTFIGNEPVDRRVWLKHLAQGDAEVGVLMQAGDKSRRKGNTFMWIGLPLTLVGTFWLTSYDAGLANNSAIVAVPITLFVGGLACDVVATVYYSKANNLYYQALRLFNNKASKGTLQPVTLGPGIGEHGVGLLMRW